MKKENKKIKVAFPHMGTIYIAWAAALRRVGVEPFIPPYTSKKNAFSRHKTFTGSNLPALQTYLRQFYRSN